MAWIQKGKRGLTLLDVAMDKKQRQHVSSLNRVLEFEEILSGFGRAAAWASNLKIEIKQT